MPGKLMPLAKCSLELEDMHFVVGSVDQDGRFGRGERGVRVE